MRHIGAVAIFCLGGMLAGIAEAQEPPTVRRALPVQSTPTPSSPLEAPLPVPTDSSQWDTPAWMQRALPAQAIAEESPAPTPYRPPGVPSSQTIQIQEPPATPPQLIPRGVPVRSGPETTFAPTPEAAGHQDSIPVAEAVTPQIAETETSEEPQSGLIRIAPGGDQDLGKARTIQNAKDYADAFYSRKMYDLAIPEYEKYLHETPESPDRAAALFRVAESHRNLKDDKAARSNYERLLRETKSGEFAGAAAYRLGGILLEDGLYSAAARNFEIASKEAGDPSVRLSALFFTARCLELEGNGKKSYELFEKVLTTEESDTRYQEYSLAALARLAAAQGKIQQGVDFYLRLAGVASSEKLRAESEIKAADLLVGEERYEEARKLLAAVASREGSGDWSSVAIVGILEIDFSEGNYQALSKLTEEDLQKLPGVSAARSRLLVAHSLRQLEKYDQALLAYDQILEKHPDTPAAEEARFNRLVCLFHKEDPSLLESLNRFLLEAKNSTELAQARLLKAETHYKAGEFAEAAAPYGAVAGSDLPKKLLAEAAYKHAWCLARTGQTPAAVVAYSDFMERFPTHEFLSQALLARGMAHLEAGAPDAAIRDFDRIVQKFPESKEKELAVLQRALIHGGRRDYAKMRSEFESLIEAYPESEARAQAEFWIGYSKFEAADYKGSIPHFEVARAREPEVYGERASLRSILANYYLELPEETAREIEAHPLPNIPSEVYQWLASKFLEQENHSAAEKYLQILLSGKAGDSPTPDLYLQLAKSRIQQKKFSEALAPLATYMDLAKEPGTRSQGMLLETEAAIGLKDLDRAEKLAEEAQILQPEGRLNAEARLLAARVQEARGNHAEAAKSFLAIAVLYDDKLLTPIALRSAAASFQKANNDAEARKALDELQLRYPQGGAEG